VTRFELFRRNVILVLRRAPRDKRAFSVVLLWLGLLAFLLYEIGSMVYLGVWGTLCVMLVLALAVGVALLMAHSNRRATDSLLKLSARPSPLDDDLREHRKAIVQALWRTAVMVDRAGGEALHKQGPEVAEKLGPFRRRTLDVARQVGVWESFSAEEREMLQSQEGSWTWEAIRPRMNQVEDVRVLRWVLGIDPVLVPFEFLRPDATPAVEITLKPEMIAGKGCLASYDLRPAQSMAQTMFTRCVSEGVRRGTLTENNPEARRQLLELAERMAADESSDLLIGETTVAKADPEMLSWIALAALRRIRVLTAVIDYLNGPATAELTIG
jgi:hypothetical protein